MIMNLDALYVRMALAQSRLNAGTVLRVAVGQIGGERVVRRKHYGVDRESGIADDVFDRSAYVVDVVMRDEPIEMQNVHALSLAELQERVKRKSGLGHTAVVEDVVTVEREYKSVRLGNVGVSQADDAKHIVAESKIVGEIAAHFILFLSGDENSSAECRMQSAELR